MGPSGRGEAIRRQRASVSRWLRFRALPPTRTMQENPRWSHTTRNLVEDIRTIPAGTMWRAREAKHVSVLLGTTASWVSGELTVSWLYLLIDIAQVSAAGAMTWVLAACGKRLRSPAMRGDA